jgi:hypothetical protein
MPTLPRAGSGTAARDVRRHSSASPTIGRAQAEQLAEAAEADEHVGADRHDRCAAMASRRR